MPALPTSTEHLNTHSYLIKNADILPKISQVLELIFKKTKHGKGSATKDAYCFNLTHKTKKPGLPALNSLNLINECLLNHRFDEAAKLLWVLCQDNRCIDLFLYKGIMVVLDNLISSEEIETFKSATRDIRKLQNINKLEVQLEFLIHALKKDLNGTEDSFYLEGKNQKLIANLKKFPGVEQLYSGYCALINYITWASTSQSDQLSQTNQDFAFTIIHSFKQIVLNPGIWDIFVLKLIEMLEYYEQYDELEEILKKYAELNPNHINAYIYLCVHLHKHNRDQEIFIQYAKKLSHLCPSDERVLLLVQKWDELGRNLKKCLKVLFAFLDYPINKHNLEGWQLLSEHLYKATSREEPSLIELIDQSWAKRNSSWNYMHFKLSNINTEAFELRDWKIKVLSILQPDHEYIKEVKTKFPNIKNIHFQKISVT